MVRLDAAFPKRGEADEEIEENRGSLIGEGREEEICLGASHVEDEVRVVCFAPIEVATVPKFYPKGDILIDSEVSAHICEVPNIFLRIPSSIPLKMAFSLPVS